MAGGKDNGFGERGRWRVEDVAVLGTDELGTCLYFELSDYRLFQDTIRQTFQLSDNLERAHNFLHGFFPLSGKDK